MALNHDNGFADESTTSRVAEAAKRQMAIEERVREQERRICEERAQIEQVILAFRTFSH